MHHTPEWTMAAVEPSGSATGGAFLDCLSDSLLLQTDSVPWSFVYRTPFAVKSPFCNTVSPGGEGPKHFPASVTNFESFPDNCCISRDCRLSGCFIMNTWKCYLLLELPCIQFLRPCKMRSFHLCAGSLYPVVHTSTFFLFFLSRPNFVAA
jgi:hypothetical protein